MRNRLCSYGLPLGRAARVRLDPPSTKSRPALAEGQRCGLTRPLVSERVGSIFEFPQWVDSGPSSRPPPTARLRRLRPFACRTRRAYSRRAWAGNLESQVSVLCLNPTGVDRLWSFSCEAAMYAEHLIDVGRRSALERVAHFLLELLTRLQAIGLADEHSYQMPLTQDLIGDALGLSVQHVSR